MTIQDMLNQIVCGRWSFEQCEAIARNLWRIGLRVQEHRKRVEREMAEIEAHRKRAIANCVDTGFVRSHSQWKRSES